MQLEEINNIQEVTITGTVVAVLGKTGSVTIMTICPLTKKKRKKKNLVMPYYMAVAGS
jgi:hypothetical protein